MKTTMEKTKPAKLAQTLLFLVEQGHVPGLLPESVLEAAATLLEQESELKTLRGALAAKDHTVSVEIKTRDYRKEIRGAFVITDPRVYFGEVFVDEFMLERSDPDWVVHVARNLASVATAAWRRDIDEKAIVAVQKALRRIETRLSPKGESRITSKR